VPGTLLPDLGRALIGASGSYRRKSFAGGSPHPMAIEVGCFSVMKSTVFLEFPCGQR
jgi:hypothetical protein